MRKGTKTIRKVYTGLNEYYVYDLDEDALGKRKRLYARTESELKEKIALAEQERSALISSYKPKTSLLSDYVRFYFKNAVGNIPSRDIKRLLTLFENAVFNTKIDKNIQDITIEDISCFYNDINEKFPLASVKEIDAVLRKTFEISNNEGISNLDLSNLKTPEKESNIITAAYILSPEEYNNLLDFCIADNCTRYGSNELIVIFSMLTGLKFSQIKAITFSNIDFQNKTIYVTDRGSHYYYSLSEKCFQWFMQQFNNNALNTVKDNDFEVPTFQKSDFVFVNSNKVSPTLQSIQSTVTSITQRCGLPKGISGKTLCKSFVINELSKGVSIDQLCKLFNKKNRRYFTEIQDEYDVRKILF